MKKYFIGYALTGREKKSVDALRIKISGVFDVHAALKIPPHITLFSPFEAITATQLKISLARLAKTQLPFTARVTSFAPFDKAVWFLNPAQDPSFTLLQKKVAEAVKESTGIDEKETRQRRHFHITIAYKDVSPKTHLRIGEFLRSQPLPIAEVAIDGITLFSRMEKDDGWKIERTFRFMGSSER